MTTVLRRTPPQLPDDSVFLQREGLLCPAGSVLIMAWEDLLGPGGDGANEKPSFSLVRLVYVQLTAVVNV